MSEYSATKPSTMNRDKTLAATGVTTLTPQTKVEESSWQSYEVTWVPQELENPQNLTLISKRIITISCCIMAFDVLDKTLPVFSSPMHFINFSDS